jgi:hypothetical protein
MRDENGNLPSGRPVDPAPATGRALLRQNGIEYRSLRGLGGLRRPRKLTPFAHVDGLAVTYPPGPEEA